jgi:hypothetical protein
VKPIHQLPVAELLAKQLHEDFRAACKAMKVPKGPHAHDHGFGDCGNRKAAYFRKRALLLLERSQNANPETLGQAEQNFQALVVLRRRVVGLEA